MEGHKFVTSERASSSTASATSRQILEGGFVTFAVIPAAPASRLIKASRGNTRREAYQPRSKFDSGMLGFSWNVLELTMERVRATVNKLAVRTPVWENYDASQAGSSPLLNSPTLTPLKAMTGWSVAENVSACLPQKVRRTLDPLRSARVTSRLVNWADAMSCQTN